MSRIAFQLCLASTALVASMAAACAQTAAPQTAGAPVLVMPMGSQQATMSLPGAAGQTGGEMPRMMEMMRPMMAGGMGMPFEHVAGRIAYLKAELNITDAQSAPWAAFADTMRTDAAEMKMAHDGMVTAGMPTTMPDRMAAQRKMMSARMGMMERSETSMTTLYAALSADQRKVFDQMMSSPMGMM